MTGDEQGIVEITRDDREGVDVVRIGGEVDLTNADAVRAAVEATRTAAVVLDLTRVAYLDSSGIRAIDLGHRHLLAGRRSLLIVSPPDTAVDWTFRVAGFKSELLVASLDAALTTALQTHRRTAETQG
jgi:anti-anti-sigma factor